MRSKLFHWRRPFYSVPQRTRGESGSSAPAAAETSSRRDAWSSTEEALRSELGYTWGPGELTYQGARTGAPFREFLSFDVGATDFSATGRSTTLTSCPTSRETTSQPVAGIPSRGCGTALYLNKNTLWSSSAFLGMWA